MGVAYTMTEEMRISELHRLYRYMLIADAEITDVQSPEPNVYHITLGWWQYCEVTRLPDELIIPMKGIEGGYKFWSSHEIILHPQVCKLSEEVLLKLGFTV